VKVNVYLLKNFVQKFKPFVLVASLSIAFVVVPVSPPATASQASHLNDGFWSVTVTSGVATVVWDTGVSDSTVYLRDEDGLVATGDSKGGHLDRVSAGERPSYTIETHSPLSNDEISQLSKHPKSERELALFEHVEISHIELSDPAGTSFDKSASAVSSVPDFSILRYTTFIASPDVEARKPICTNGDALGNYRFRGDNRNFGPANTSFRTRFDVRVDWLRDGSMSKFVEVGETVLEKDVNGVWRVDSRRTASSSSMDLMIRGLPNSSKASFSIQQNVTNPFCPDVGAGIKFDYDIDIWRSGTYHFAGTAVRVPNHEVYIKDEDNPSWAIVMRRAVYSFDCLNPFLNWLMPCEVSDDKTAIR
jgi:hypothetical protein